MCSSALSADRALEIGAERLFHDDARTSGETGFGHHLDRRQRGVRRHAHIMDAFGFRRSKACSAFIDRAFQGPCARLPAARSRAPRRRPATLPPSRLCARVPSDRLMRQVAEAFRVDVVERHADDPAFRNEASGDEMEEARQELPLRQVSGRAEQHDDLRQFRPNPGRYPRHSRSPPMLLAQRGSSSHATAARQGLPYWLAHGLTVAV